MNDVAMDVRQVMRTKRYLNKPNILADSKRRYIKYLWELLAVSLAVASEDRVSVCLLFLLTRILSYAWLSGISRVEL